MPAADFRTIPKKKAAPEVRARLSDSNPMITET
jgi:hypothetical protein